MDCDHDTTGYEADDMLHDAEHIAWCEAAVEAWIADIDAHTTEDE
jgi:hypothetical protein